MVYDRKFFDELRRGRRVLVVPLVRMTGIPVTEAQPLRSRTDDYADYRRTTSVPLPPRRRVTS
jgi:hypothetical protein